MPVARITARADTGREPGFVGWLEFEGLAETPDSLTSTLAKLRALS